MSLERAEGANQDTIERRVGRKWDDDLVGFGSK